MQITLLNRETIEIKSKNATVVAGNQSKINNVELMGPGEYEIGGVEVFGISNHIYVFRVEDINIAFLYSINRPLTQQENEALTDVSMVILPVGEGSLDTKTASQIIKALEPSVVIPYQGSDMTEFCQAAGVCQEPISVYKINKHQLELQEGQLAIQLIPSQ
jgi:hypothetical protein